MPCSRRKIKSRKGERVPPLSAASQLTAQSRFDWAKNALSPKGYVHNIPDSFCNGKKTIPDRASVHDKNGDFKAISITELSYASPVSNVESHVLDMICVHSIPSFSYGHQRNAIRCSVKIAYAKVL